MSCNPLHSFAVVFVGSVLGYTRQILEWHGFWVQLEPERRCRTEGRQRKPLEKLGGSETEGKDEDIEMHSFCVMSAIVVTSLQESKDKGLMLIRYNRTF